MGKIMGYTISIPDGKIVKEYSEKELRVDWGKYIGRRFDQMM